MQDWSYRQADNGFEILNRDGEVITVIMNETLAVKIVEEHDQSLEQVAAMR